jgi:acetoin utilization protein AcuC
MTGRVLVAWDDALLGYDLGEHPLDPVRVELTIALATALGVLDRPGVRVAPPPPADDRTLRLVHSADYLAAVKEAPRQRFFQGWGLGTPDNPVFERMHEASARVAGATVACVEAVWRGEVDRAVNIAGGLHHAMPSRASGFCVYNDPAIGIARLLELGAERIAYVDIDVHHGDGVQEVFSHDPRVLTVSLHESPLTLFPGTGFPTETGGAGAPGTAVNVALPPGTDDAGWLRAFHAVVPPVVRAFRPQVLVSQCGVDGHRLDPLANLMLTVDGQRAAYLALRDLAEECCGGRWVATGGGGYALVEVVPRAWSHLLAVVTGEALDPATPTPAPWRALAARRRPGADVPLRLTDGADPSWRAWQPTGGGADADPVDRAIAATRKAAFPLHGLDPYDPRD